MENVNRYYQALLSVLTNEATEEERHLLEDWLKQSDSNRVEFEKIKRLYERSSAAGVTDPVLDVERAWKNVDRQTTSRTHSFRPAIWMRYAAIASILISMSVVIFLSRQTPPTSIVQLNMEKLEKPTLLLDNGEVIDLTKKSFSRDAEHATITNEADNQLSYVPTESVVPDKKEKEIPQNRLIIPQGQTYKVTLSDGTQIWLNSETELIYPGTFAGDKREVTLIGEAYFQVAKEADRPFSIKTNNVEVNVLGTSFNVCSYQEDTQLDVTLVEGSVAVRIEGKEQVEIKPSEQLVYDKANNQTKVQVVNTQLYTSWIEGKYIFKNATLGEIVRKLKYWYDFSVDYEDELLRSKRFSLTMEREESIDKLLEVISSTSDIQLERYENSIHIKKQRR